MMNIYTTATIVLTLMITACTNQNENSIKKGGQEQNQPQVSSTQLKSSYRAAIKEFSDEEYPDNPDIQIRSALDGNFHHEEVEFLRRENGLFDVLFLPGIDSDSDTILLENIDLREWIPTIPNHLKDNEYLMTIGVVNQEWNRQQVQFPNGTFQILGNGDEHANTQRVDFARNCLNAGLWEVITYAKEDGTLKPMYHGWFDFPRELYAGLFMERNGISYEKYADILEHWTDPDQQKVDLNVLRDVRDEFVVPHTSRNIEMYPMVGERFKKARNILCPKTPEKIGDFLTDSAEFATFSPPGVYEKSTPRKTKLGRLAVLDTVYYRLTASNLNAHDDEFEVELVFRRKGDSAEKTRFIVGGLQYNAIPTLRPENANNGYQMPMGISNHTFYETYRQALNNPSTDNPYFGLLLTDDGKFLDSHAVGIDGPLLHWDKDNPNKLHFWILSFERHALVGHYIIDITARPPA